MTNISNSGYPAGFEPNLATSVFMSGDATSEIPNTEEEDFVEECLGWLDKWNETHKALDKKELHPCMFIFDGTKPIASVIDSSNRRLGFKGALEFYIGDAIYACTANLENVYFIEHQLKNISDALTLLESDSFKNTTAVIWLPLESVAYVHEVGGDTNLPRRIPLTIDRTELFDFTKIDHHLEVFYESYVSTHEAFCDVWKKAKERILKESPEKQIQKNLIAHFHFGVLPRSAKASREYQTHRGREDVQIIRANSAHELETAILELKVLFKTKTEQWNIDWAMKGINQVVDYAKADTVVKERYICCYDGRAEDLQMPTCLSYANSKEVKWRRYFMTTPGCLKVHDFES